MPEQFIKEVSSMLKGFFLGETVRKRDFPPDREMGCSSGRVLYNARYNISPLTNCMTPVSGPIPITSRSLPSLDSTQSVIATWASVAGVLFLILLTLTTWLCLRRKKQRKLALQRRIADESNEDFQIDTEVNSSRATLASSGTAVEKKWISRIFGGGNAKDNDSDVELGSRKSFLKGAAPLSFVREPARSMGSESESSMDTRRTMMRPGQGVGSSPGYNWQEDEGADISTLRSSGLGAKSLAPTSAPGTKPFEKGFVVTSGRGPIIRSRREIHELDISLQNPPVNHHQRGHQQTSEDGDEDSSSTFARVSKSLDSHARTARVVKLEKCRAKRLSWRTTSSEKIEGSSLRREILGGESFEEAVMKTPVFGGKSAGVGAGVGGSGPYMGGKGVWVESVSSLVGRESRFKEEFGDESV